MSHYTTNQFRNGLKILVDNDPHIILENEFVKPGKGQAFNRIKLRNLITGRVLDRTYKSGESVIAADVIEIEVQYLYNDGKEWHFMNKDTFEQYVVSADMMKDAKNWIKPENICTATLHNDIPIVIDSPNFVELKVGKTDPGVRGDTATGGTKLATLETGVVVKVPLFVEPGEILRIDTRSGEYVSRVK